MYKVKITALARTEYPELIEKYENPIENPCSIKIGEEYISYNLEKPNGFCESAWQSIYPFAMTLAYGGKDFFDGWMKNPRSALISCNDGFRPVSFLIEAVESSK